MSVTTPSYVDIRSNEQHAAGMPTVLSTCTIDVVRCHWQATVRMQGTPSFRAVLPLYAIVSGNGQLQQPVSPRWMSHACRRATTWHISASTSSLSTDAKFAELKNFAGKRVTDAGVFAPAADDSGAVLAAVSDRRRSPVPPASPGRHATIVLALRELSRSSCAGR